MSFNKKPDLTRWNRAGLSEFHYLDANAVTNLETLRQQLVEEYEIAGEQIWQELVDKFPEMPGETRTQARKRLTGQYYDDRRDYAWEILRTFARSGHVLGEYINAYANEGYLPTAIEWDNVRKLVGMIGYRPSPPASAETHIALLYKEGESGDVEKGFAVKNKPKDGEATVVFETQEKLEGHHSLNRLRLVDWDRNKSTLKPAGLKGKKGKQGKKSRKSIRFMEAPDTIRFPLEEPNEEISVGDMGVLAVSGSGVPVKVVKMVNAASAPYLDLRILVKDRKKINFTLYNTWLYLRPGFVESPLANGDGSALLRDEAILASEEIVFGRKSGQWRAMQVMENEKKHVRFSSGKSVKSGEKLFRALVLNQQEQPKLDEDDPVYVLPHGDDGSRGIFVDSNLKKISGKPQKRKIVDEDGKTVETNYFMAGNHGERIYYPAADDVAIIKKVGLSEVRFSGKASDFESGTWTIVTQRDKSLHASLISEIEQEEEWFQVELEGAGKSVALLRAGFKLALRPRDHAVNGEKAWSASSTDSVTILNVQKADGIGELQLGQKLICASETCGVAVELKDIVKNGTQTQLHLAPPFHLDPAASGLTRHNCVLYGNAVRATHGETQPDKILGNGDASQTSQRFDLPSDKVSWVADSTFATGVRADLNLRVGQRTWQQIEDLSKSGPEDHHYQVKVNEDGVLSACFGDGRHGRRLPTGIDNVRVSYRTGYGEEGNLDARDLEKIARPHRLVEDFIAPLPSSGGADKESAESMRESAPATVLALERAVSLDDFTHLASHHSMVWQARAFEKMPDRPARPLIEVVVVPAGGVTFTPGSETARLIEGYLEQHSAPGTPVTVVSYRPLLMQLSLTLMVDEAAYDRKLVELAVREHLEESLALKRRKLGEPLFRSEVIALLEEVEGVENGHCQILQAPWSGLDAESKPRLHTGDDGEIRRVSVKPDQLLYLDTDHYPLGITIEQFRI